MAIQSGLTIQGYELLERIGAGGFGVVYRAYQSTVGREVAVKIILPAYANQPEFIRQFEKEAQLIARLEHLHIVPLYDYWRDPKGAYIVMRWLRGGSLSGALQNGAFSLEEASSLLDQVASGLAAAHLQQIVHRDLKPSNILLDEEGNAYLADFGIARDLRHPNGTVRRSKGSNQLDSDSKEQIIGSIQYLSPEQLLGQQATAQSDIYSLGVTLYESLSGQHPFPGLNSVQQLYKHIDVPIPRIETLDPEVSEAVNQVIQKATAKNPKHRYQDALTMAAAFRDSIGLHGDSHTVDLVESLTRREQEILHLIIEGNTNQQIAQNLFLELSTVKWHVNRIYKKLGVRSRVQAIVRARELNLIVPTNDTEGDSAHNTSTSVVLPEPANPYKGLRAFEPADNRDFFGREELVEKLLSRLAPTNASSFNPSVIGLTTNGEERFLVIVGPSGSGKSSLIKAGLIPALWSGELTGSEKWFIVDMLPGARPLDNLEIALTRIAADQASNLRKHLERDAHGLARAAGLILPKDGSELVVIIDQFEELFTLVEDEATRVHFMDLIYETAIDPRSRVRVVIALRADYYDRPLQYPSFGKLVGGHLETLLPLSAEELERAIVNPAYQTGVTFEPGLVATIIEDVNYRPGALPLLQFALTELYEQRDGRTLTHSAYSILGGATGALTRRAEELYQEQDAEGREAIRQMFLRLVSVTDQNTGATSDIPSQADTRKRVPRSELLSATNNPERLEEIIDTFSDYRLLSLDHNSATRRATVEVAHEAILREWDRLQSWLQESRVDLSLHHQLVGATHDWIEAGADQSFLLHGSRLARFENWLNYTPLVLTETERTFLAESLALKEEKAAAERERQERVARLEQQSNRRLKTLVIVMAMALLVAVGLAIAALSFARRVETQQHLVEVKDRQNNALELASAARANLESDPELSVLLSLEAAEITYSTDGTLPYEVELILRQAVRADLVNLTIKDGGALAFSPDGKKLAIGNQYGVLRLWNATTGKVIWKQAFYQSSINDIAFSQDGRFLATLNSYNLVDLWDVSSGQNIGNIRGEGQINAFAFNPDGQQLVTAGADGVIRNWELFPILGLTQEGPEIAELSESLPLLQTPDEAIDVAFSPDGQRLAVLLPGKSIILVDPTTRQQSLTTADVSYFATSVTFSSDGYFMASASSDLGATVWDARTGQEILTVLEDSVIAAIDFSPDGRYLATATEDGKSTLWEIATGRVTLRLSGHSSAIDSIDFSPNGRQIATSSQAGVTRLWDIVPDGGKQFTVIAHQGNVHDAVYNPQGTKIASAGEDGTVKLWDAATGALLHTLPGQMVSVHFPVFSPDGQMLAAANDEGGVTIWDATTGEELLAVKGDAPAYTAVAFSPDGTKLAAGGLEGTAHIWDATTGDRLTDLSYAGNTIIELIFSPDGEFIRSYDWDGTQYAWDAITGEIIGGNDKHGFTIWDVELAADGQLGAMACSKAIVFYPQDQPEAEETVYTLGGLTEFITGVAFNPEGTILATSSSNNGLKLWDMDSGEEMATLSDHSLSLNGVDFSPDGRYLVTAGSDGTVSVYIISIEELIETARSRLSRGFTLEECRNYLNLLVCPVE